MSNHGSMQSTESNRRNYVFAETTGVWASDTLSSNSHLTGAKMEA